MMWYKKTWFMWLCLFLFAPVGVFLLWKYGKFGKIPKTILSVFFGIVFLTAVLQANSEDLTGAAETPGAQIEETTEPITSQLPAPSPTQNPTATPTEESTEEPTATPIEESTEEPTATPTEEPTEESTATLTEEPTEESTATLTEEPTEKSTATPTEGSTEESTTTPTEEPTEESTATPTEEPTPTPEPEIASESSKITVYVSNASKTIHSVSDCSGMKNYSTKTLEEARKITSKYCKTCGDSLKSKN